MGVAVVAWGLGGKEYECQGAGGNAGMRLEFGNDISQVGHSEQWQGPHLPPLESSSWFFVVSIMQGGGGRDVNRIFAHRELLVDLSWLLRVHQLPWASFCSEIPSILGASVLFTCCGL